MPAPQAGTNTADVELSFGRGDVDFSRIAIGGAVWLTDDPQLRRRLAGTFARVEPWRRVGLAFRVLARVGEPISLLASDDSGRSVRVAGSVPLSPSVKCPLTVELLAEQFGRLGQTPYALAAVALSGPVGAAETVDVLVPKSELNDLRRRAVAALLALRAAESVHRIAEEEALAHLRAEALPELARAPRVPLLCVLLRDAAQLRALLDWHASGPAGGGCDLVYADLPEPAEWAEALAAGREAGVPVGWVTPRILKPGDVAAIDRVAELAPPPAAVLVRNLGSLARLRRLAPAVPLVGDFSLNAANELAAAWFCQAGLARLAPGWDVDFARLRQLAERFPPSRLEAIVYAHVPMFHTQYCLWAAHIGEGQGGECGRACLGHTLALRDRKGMVMPARRDAGCRTTIFRGRADNHVARLAELAALGVGAVRLEMLDEPPAQVVEIAGRCRELLAGR